MPDWRKQWKEFAAGKPGRRFRDRHERLRETSGPHRWRRRLFNIAGTIVCLAVGAFLVFVPGPAVVFFALAGIMIASESNTAARLLDWLDVRSSPLRRHLLRIWRRRTPVQRRLIAGGAVLSGMAFFAVGLVMLL